IDPDDPAVKSAVSRLATGFHWHESLGGKPFFEGETEPCINGGTLALGGALGRPEGSPGRRLLGEQLGDGGWDCEAPQSQGPSVRTEVRRARGVARRRGGGGVPVGDGGGPPARRGVPPRAGPLPAAFDGRGRAPVVPPALVPAPLLLRRPPRPRLFPGRRRGA